MNLLRLTVAGLWVIFLGYWLAASFGVKRNLAVGRAWENVLLRVVGLVLIIAAVHLIGGARVGRAGSVVQGNLWVGGLGVALCLAGIGFAVWARMHLGRNWGMPMSVKEDAELVTSGPYAWVRHPIYTGVLVAAAGSALVAGPAYLIIVLPLALYFVYSAKTEERVMLERFAERYRAYMARTKRLIPFVY